MTRKARLYFILSEAKDLARWFTAWLLTLALVFLPPPEARASLAFSDGSNNHVDHGSATAIDNLGAGTILLWFFPTTVANAARVIVSKGRFGTDVGIQLHKRGVDGTSVRFTVGRATTEDAAITATGFVAANTWYFLAGTWDVTGGNAPKIYKGTLTNAVALNTTGTPGSGAQKDDSAEPLRIGKDTTTGGGANNAWGGRVAFFALYNRVLTLEEIKSQQWRPFKMSGCVAMTHYGWAGTGTQPDLCGNGNSGTPSNATVADHVPIVRYP